MVKLIKCVCLVCDKVDFIKEYEINEVVVFFKELVIVKFVESVDVFVNFGIDVKKFD